MKGLAIIWKQNINSEGKKLSKSETESQRGKFPVSLMWSRVLRKPNFSTAWLAALKPFPYISDVSVAIWFLKNMPSFFSKGDLATRLEVDALLPSEED